MTEIYEPSGLEPRVEIEEAPELELPPHRRCNVCGAEVGPDIPDACMGELPGVVEACCGHGDHRKAYVTYDTGLIIRGFTVQKRPNSWGERV